MEKLVVSLLLSVIVAVAAFNIVASLVLMVADKRKDIAVVRTLGAPSSLVIKGHLPLRAVHCAIMIVRSTGAAASQICLNFIFNIQA